jgi:hypothetical protein
MNANDQSQFLLPEPIVVTESHSISQPLSDYTEANTQRSALCESDISQYRQQTPLFWIIIIILGQLMILAMAWIFFMTVYHYGPIPFPDEMAARAAKSPRTVTLVVTLVSTAISLVLALYVHYMILVVYVLTSYPVCSGAL